QDRSERYGNIGRRYARDSRTRPALGNARGQLSADASSLRPLLYDHDTACLGDGGSDRIPIDGREAPHVDHFRIDPAFGGQALCRLDAIVSHQEPAEHRYVAALASQSGLTERNKIVLRRDLAGRIDGTRLRPRALRAIQQLVLEH